MSTKKKCSDQAAQIGFAFAEAAAEGRTTSPTKAVAPETTSSAKYARTLEWMSAHNVKGGADSSLPPSDRD